MGFEQVLYVVGQRLSCDYALRLRRDGLSMEVDRDFCEALCHVSVMTDFE